MVEHALQRQSQAVANLVLQLLQDVLGKARLLQRRVDGLKAVGSCVELG